MPHMIAFGWVMGIQPSWLGKHTLFAPPFGWFMRWLGGIPIDRRAPQGTVGQLVERFGDPDKPFVLVIPPEGTRKGGALWKSGFHHIARGLDVPIVLGYLDYARRRGGCSPPMEPTDDLRADMDRIREFYSKITARCPEKFTPPRLKEEGDRAEADDGRGDQGAGTLMR